MQQWLQMFQSRSGKFQVSGGFGRLVSAGAMEAFIGHGLFHELFRDHEWLFISAVTPKADNQVEIEYLTLERNQKQTSEGNSHSDITEERPLKHTLTFGRGDQILISISPIKRPEGCRITVTTTRTVEPLTD